MYIDVAGLFRRGEAPVKTGRQPSQKLVGTQAPPAEMITKESVKCMEHRLRWFIENGEKVLYEACPIYDRGNHLNGYRWDKVPIEPEQTTNNRTEKAE